MKVGAEHASRVLQAAGGLQVGLNRQSCTILPSLNTIHLRRLPLEHSSCSTAVFPWQECHGNGAASKCGCKGALLLLQAFDAPEASAVTKGLWGGSSELVRLLDIWNRYLGHSTGCRGSGVLCLQVAGQKFTLLPRWPPAQSSAPTADPPCLTGHPAPSQRWPAAQKMT